jgi:hypothetical protein
MSVSSEGDPEDGQGPGGVAGVLAEGGGTVDWPGAAERTDGEVAQAGHDLWAGPGAQPGGVLGEGHIPDPVQAVLDRPVPTDEVGQPGGVGLGVGEAGDRVDDHGPPPPGAQVTELEADEVGASLKWATAKVERTSQRGNGERTSGRERATERGGDFNDPAPF